ncbi:ribosome small subunit-dependent GTPase A [Chloroflexota bacterium]
MKLISSAIKIDGMELYALGFNEWFVQRLKESGKTDYHVARVTSVNKGGYLVRNEDGEVLSELAGEFMFSAESSLQYPAVGDWAFVQYYNADTLAIIYDLLPRKTILKRKAAGRKIDYQMIAANIDVAFIVQSCDFNFNLRRLERYLVMINDGHIDPVILLSKSDLVSQQDLERKVSEIRNTGIECEVIAYSIETGSGLPQIQQVLKSGMTYCLLGSSGVGKTTLLNHLIGRDAFRINLVREKDGKGRHTTSRRQLVVLDRGAMLIDTPGMRELGNIGVGSGIEESFSDILKLSGNCRFKDCTHTHEVGCSVLRAVRSGSLNEVHYQDYLKLNKESEHYQMSYVERRRKDRKFGQFIKSAMKQIKKNS